MMSARYESTTYLLLLLPDGWFRRLDSAFWEIWETGHSLLPSAGALLVKTHNPKYWLAVWLPNSRNYSATYKKMYYSVYHDVNCLFGPNRTTHVYKPEDLNFRAYGCFDPEH